MTLTWQQTGIALFVALALHGSIAVWLALPAPELAPEPPKQPLRVSLSAIIAQTTTPVALPEPPPVQQPMQPLQQKVKPPTPKPVPPPNKPKPKPAPQPVQQQAKLEPIPEPIAELIATPESIETAPPTPSTPPDSIATARYEQLLVAWLEKYKKYPRRAKRMRIEGEGRLRISINRSGETQNITLEQRTGNRLLDKTALEMAERANPFPPMPENDPRQALEFVVPVVFALR